MSGWRALPGRLIFSLASLALLGACSPASRLQVRVIVPTGAPSLYVTGAKTCPPGPVAIPLAATTSGDAYHATQEPESGSVIVTAAFRGSHCNARLTVWMDSDGDGKPSSGDYVGSTPVVEIRDRGILAGNLTRARDLVLSRLP